MRRKVSIKDVGPKGIGLVAKVTLLISPFFFSGVRCAYAVSPCCLSALPSVLRPATSLKGSLRC